MPLFVLSVEVLLVTTLSRDTTFPCIACPAHMHGFGGYPRRSVASSIYDCTVLVGADEVVVGAYGRGVRAWSRSGTRPWGTALFLVE
jgi:hypothetical protein